MPIYEYACTHCEHSFDELQKLSEAALVHCPKCGEPALRKLLSAPKFRLKGQGWYETDFKTGDKRNLHDSASAADTKPVSGDGKKTKTGSDSMAAWSAFSRVARWTPGRWCKPCARPSRRAGPHPSRPTLAPMPLVRGVR